MQKALWKEAVEVAGESFSPRLCQVLCPCCRVEVCEGPLSDGCCPRMCTPTPTARPNCNPRKSRYVEKSHESGIRYRVSAELSRDKDVMQLAGKAQSTAFLQRDHVQRLEVAVQLQLPDGRGDCVLCVFLEGMEGRLPENGAVPALGAKCSKGLLIDLLCSWAQTTPPSSSPLLTGV